MADGSYLVAASVTAFRRKKHEPTTKRETEAGRERERETLAGVKVTPIVSLDILSELLTTWAHTTYKKKRLV